MKDRQLYAFFLVSVIFAGITSLSPAVPSSTNSVIIRSNGRLSLCVTAKSGSAKDIQAAVNQIVAGGIGNVYIPSGTFNFVNVGEPWVTVSIPAGVNLFGAPTQRYANGSVVSWNTILEMPYEAPDSSCWFYIDGIGTNTTTRISDIKLVGWRYTHNSSTTMYYGIYLEQCLDFRIDHCDFQDICGSAIWVDGYDGGTGGYQYTENNCSGVIDHCILNNTYGDPGWQVYENRTLGYGIGMRRWACDVWDTNVSSFWGQYTNYTIVIEDNYFSKWRHSTCSNDGFRQIVRFNIFEGCYGIGEVDGHGSYADDYHPNAVGTRSMEIYNNTFQNPDTRWNANTFALNIRRGSVLAFNNTLIGYYGLLDFNNDFGNYAPYCPQCAVNDTYVWNNNLGNGTLIHYDADSVENVNYFLRAPNLQQDGLTYTPYPYPDPLTLVGVT